MAEGSSADYQQGVHGIITSITTIKEGHLEKLKATLEKIGGSPDSPIKQIATIHFARWVIIDRGTRLLFTSNFDESWNDYIDMFIEKAAGGLDLIWSNCEGYPEGGAKDSEAFKAYVRQSEFTAEVFYCAYPDLTVKQILKDEKIRKHSDAVVQGVTALLEEGSY